MTQPGDPYYLLIDTNIWVSERMLKTAVGGAVLYALTADGSSIVLPEIVEKEVKFVLIKHAAKATDEVRKHGEFLRHISGQSNMPLSVPEPQAIERGISKRWIELDGSIIRAPYDLEQAQDALQRVLEHALPSRENNEQFRDCCIWVSALRYAQERPVHLVTGDSAFYRKGSDGEIAVPLRDELKDAGLDIRLYPSLDRFLEAVSGEPIQELERNIIRDAILEAIAPAAHYAATQHNWMLDIDRDTVEVTIRGYATPQPSVVAITFEVRFNLGAVDIDGKKTDIFVIFDGSCAFYPSKHQTDDLIITSSKYSLLNLPGWTAMKQVRQAAEDSESPGWHFL